MARTSLNIDEIIKTSLESVKILDRFEYLSLFDALDRVIYDDIFATKDLPAFDNSAMDGYAVRLSDSGKYTPVIDDSFAGDDLKNYELKDGSCCKIMTGAPTPAGTEAVVPFENVLDKRDNSIKLPESLKLNANIKFKAEEVSIGDKLISKGEKLSSNHLATLASQGISSIRVYKKVKVGVFSTGNEIKEPWEQTSEHQIYNSNSMGIYSVLKEHNFEAIYLGSLGDDIESIKEGFLLAKSQCDVLVTSGGISKGEADFIGDVLEILDAKVLFHGVNVKPGRPNLMALLDDLVFFGLPGNPLSALVNLNLFVVPAVAKMSGDSQFFIDFIYAKNTQEFKLKDSRANIVLGSYQNGEFRVTRDNRYGSGMLTPLLESNAFIVIEKGVSIVEQNQSVKIVPFKASLTDKNISYLNL